MAVTLLLVLACAQAAGATTVEISALEARMVASRRAMQTWHIKYTIHVPIGAEGQEPLEVVSIVDGVNQRHSWVERPSDFERRHVADDEFVTHHFIYGEFGEITCGHPGRALQIDQTLEPAREPLHGLVPHQVGWHAYGISFNTAMSDLLRNVDYVDRRLVDDVRGGVACKKLTFTQKPMGHRHTLWIAPARGSSVLKYSIDYQEGETSGTVQTVYDVAQWRDTGIWYPVSWVHEMTADSKVTRYEEVDVEIISLNEPIDKELFKATSLGVPVGKRTYLRPNPAQATYTWDGEKPVAAN